MHWVVREDLDELAMRLEDMGRDLEDSTVLVTGGAGFLGSWLCDVLHRFGARVICLDNFSSGLRENVEHLEGDRFLVVVDDVSRLDPRRFIEDLPRSFSEVDLILHLASRASPLEFEKYPIDILRANSLGTMNMLELARMHDARLLFASSSEVYGNPSVVPTPESYYGYVNPIGPRSCYDEGKRFGEALCMAYHRQYGLDVRIARIFNTYGPRMRAEGVYGRVIPRFVKQALSNEPLTIFGDGEQTRSFCYVTDQVEGLVKLLLTPRARGEVVNIGNPEEIRIIDLAKLVIEITGSRSDITFLPPMPDDPRRRCPDISKAKELLNWEPRTSLRRGLERYVAWFKERKGYGR